MKNKKKITVAGMGYVGLSNCLLLSRSHSVVGFDINKNKIFQLSRKKSPIDDKEINNFLKKEKINVKFTNSKNLAYKESDIIFIATPTNYDSESNFFDTSMVESVIQDILSINTNISEVLIVIRSTIPIGFIDMCRIKYNHKKIIFCPEFLREGKALYDSLRPSRIVVGEKNTDGEIVANLLSKSAIKKNIPIIYTGSNEAESIKLFANTYLAMRVSYFNELDTFAAYNNLDSKEIINGISYDHRIGSHYNNPSFGYGGYCLPKDTKQLLSNFSQVPNNLIKAIVKSNSTRKRSIVKLISKHKPKVIGIYRLVMKSGSDNFRSSAILDIIEELNKKYRNIIIYEPSIESKKYMNCKIVNDINLFKNEADLIVANRQSKEIKDFKGKIFTRDIFGTDA